MNLGETIAALLRNPETPDYAIRDAVIERAGEGYAVANVYVVTGRTGEYSDHFTWTVAAFLDSAQAAAFCRGLNDWCEARGLHERSACYDENGEWLANEEDRPSPPNDPNFHSDYTGTKYSVVEVPLRAE